MAAPGILVVDDMPENLAVLGEILGSAGYGVRIAKSGAAALQLAALEPLPALILLDIMMPEMDGYEVLARLRAGAATADIPVVFLTALDDPDAVVKGLQAGAVDYIAKPVQPEVVLARVRSQIEVARARRWLRDQNALLEAEVARRLAEIRKVQSRAEQEEAEHNRQRELILASAAEGIFGVDRDGVINFVNPAAAQMLGYGRDELTGRSAHDLLKPPSAAGEDPASGDCPVRLCCTSGVAIPRRERTVWRKDGRSLVLEFSCTPILRDGRPAGAVVTLLDISERKRYLEQLERKSNFDDLTGLPN
ncbi:partial Cyclic di-GMP phosphodiesterase, partial [Rhodocyclaceae bacterium]